MTIDIHTFITLFLLALIILFFWNNGCIYCMMGFGSGWLMTVVAYILYLYAVSSLSGDLLLFSCGCAIGGLGGFGILLMLSYMSGCDSI